MYPSAIRFRCFQPAVWLLVSVMCLNAHLFVHDQARSPWMICPALAYTVFSFAVSSACALLNVLHKIFVGLCFSMCSFLQQKRYILIHDNTTIFLLTRTENPELSDSWLLPIFAMTCLTSFWLLSICLIVISLSLKPSFIVRVIDLVFIFPVCQDHAHRHGTVHLQVDHLHRPVKRQLQSFIAGFHLCF